MAREERDETAGGLKLETTSAALRKAWIAMTGAAPIAPTMRDHRSQHFAAAGTWDEPDLCAWRRLLRAVHGCRTCGLGLSIARIHRFERTETPQIHRAREVRQAVIAFGEFRRSMRRASPDADYEFAEPFEAIKERLRDYVWPLHRSPSAMHELRRKRGPRIELLAADVVEFLANASYSMAEIAELIDDGHGTHAKTKRLDQVLRVRLALYGDDGATSSS